MDAGENKPKLFEALFLFVIDVNLTRWSVTNNIEILIALRCQLLSDLDHHECGEHGHFVF